MLVALGSVKASPGVTTTALALAATWPNTDPVVLVEADPDGGSLAARLGAAAEPGLTTLAAAARRDDRVSLLDHAQQLIQNVPVVVAPPSSDQVRASLATPGVVRSLRGFTGGDVIIDCGRLNAHSPSLDLAVSADVVLLVGRPRLEEAHHLVHAAGAMARRCPHVLLLVVGSGPYSPREMADALEVELAGSIPDDPASAAPLAGSTIGRTRRGRRHRSPLFEAAQRVGERLLRRGEASTDSEDRNGDGAGR